MIPNASSPEKLPREPGTAGPLAELKIVELAGIGPAPFAAMMLGDLGADVIRVDRDGGHAGNPVPPQKDLLNRNRRSIELNLKDSADLKVAKELIATADVLIEGYRPGVTERLGLGPNDCLAINPKLVYARMTGWGQTGPLAQRAGHDINYISRVGALHPIGLVDGPPVIPLNIVGDFGGGGMLLAFGLMAAVHHANRTGQGQVVDAAITDGTALLTTMVHTWRAASLWEDRRGSNMLDGGAHFYHVYETADGRYLSVGAIEPQFYSAFVDGLGVVAEGDWLESHGNTDLWPTMTARVAEIVRTRRLDQWLEIFDGTDACVSPVLTLDESMTDEHNKARSTFVEVGGVSQPAPAPRFDRTPPPSPRPQPVPGKHSAEIRSALEESKCWPSEIPTAATSEAHDE